jgi:AraC-like DNA-binding protein
VEELKEGRGVQRLERNGGALPRLRGRGEQGYVVNDNLDRALLYRLREGDRELWRCCHCKIRLRYKSSIGAKQSVQNGIALSVSEICSRIGYQDVASFSRLFAKSTGDASG